MTYEAGRKRVVGGTPRPHREVSRETAPAPASVQGEGAANEVVRLTNRTAALTLAAAFAGIAALVAVGRVVSSGATGVARLAAAVLTAAALVTAVAVWRSRVKLHAAQGGAAPRAERRTG